MPDGHCQDNCRRWWALPARRQREPAGLHKDLVATFAEASDDRRRSVDESARPAVDAFEETDKGHGRVEKRSVELCRDLGWMMTADRWDGLACLVKVTRERTVLATNKTSTETAYYIGSDTRLDAPSAANRIRRHWSVENELHWVLDMAFREDEARHRSRNTAQNMTTLRHFALNLLSATPSGSTASPTPENVPAGTTTTCCVFSRRKRGSPDANGELGEPSPPPDGEDAPRQRSRRGRDVRGTLTLAIARTSPLQGEAMARLRSPASTRLPFPGRTRLPWGERNAWSFSHSVTWLLQPEHFEGPKIERVMGQP